MPKVVLNGPMRGYYLRGTLFKRGVPSKPISQALRDECIATGKFSDVSDPNAGVPVTKAGGVRVFGGAKKAAQEAEASGDPDKPPFSGEGAKKLAEDYGRKVFGVEMDRRNTVETLNTKLGQLADGVSPDEIKGVRLLTDVEKADYGTDLVPV